MCLHKKRHSNKKSDTFEVCCVTDKAGKGSLETTEMIGVMMINDQFEFYESIVDSSTYSYIAVKLATDSRGKGDPSVNNRLLQLLCAEQLFLLRVNNTQHI